MKIGHEIKVLDHGYVRYADRLGDDEDIVDAARISTGRGFVSWEPYMRCRACGQVWLSTLVDRPVCLAVETSCRSTEFERFPRGDLGILEYLYKNRHTTPFEMCELVIDVQCPMDVWRQWIRHRTASVNEYSTRYSEAIDLAMATPADKWRTQGKTNRQGSGEFLHAGVFDAGAVRSPGPGDHLSNREAAFLKEAREVYEERLAMGVAKEQARKDLPLSTYTAARWKCDLKNTLHFLGLRMHPHAQAEIRAYANAVAEIVRELWPRTYALFEEYDLHGVRLSRSEAALLSGMLRAVPIDLQEACNDAGWSNAQRDALREKFGLPKS